MARVLCVCVIGLTACPNPPQSTDKRLADLDKRPADATWTLTHTRGARPVCILTQYTANCDGFARVAAENHEAYATRHGYHYFRFRGRVSGEQFSDPQRSDAYIFRDGLYWQKLAATRMVLEEKVPERQQPLCDTVMWVDSDVLFTNMARSLEFVTESYGHSDVILSREQKGYPGTLINSGVYFVRNNPGGEQFIEDVSDMYEEYKNRGLPEQDAFQDWVFQVPQNHPRREDYEFLIKSVRSNVSLAPQRLFNSFYQPHQTSMEAVHWQACDFIAHFANVPYSKREGLMRQLADNLPHCEN